jgi:ABC-type polar amino acid transport system ATPase subunit
MGNRAVCMLRLGDKVGKAESLTHHLEQVRIPEQAHKYPAQLSSCQQQRVAIARRYV